MTLIALHKWNGKKKQPDGLSRAFKFIKLFSFILLISVSLASCQTGSNKTPSVPENPISTENSNPIPTSPSESNLNPIFTLTLPESSSDSAPMGSLIWLAGNQLGVATPDNVLIADLPTEGPSVQMLTTARSAGEATNPIFLTSTSSRSNLIWVSQESKIFYWNLSETLPAGRDLCKRIIHHRIKFEPSF